MTKSQRTGPRVMHAKGLWFSWLLGMVQLACMHACMLAIHGDIVKFRSNCNVDGGRCKISQGMPYLVRIYGLGVPNILEYLVQGYQLQSMGRSYFLWYQGRKYPKDKLCSQTEFPRKISLPLVKILPPRTEMIVSSWTKLSYFNFQD